MSKKSDNSKSRFQIRLPNWNGTKKTKKSTMKVVRMIVIKPIISTKIMISLDWGSIACIDQESMAQSQGRFYLQ